MPALGQPQPVSYYYNTIIGYKNNMASLAALDDVANPNSLPPYQALMNAINTQSRVGRWNLMAWIVAGAMYTFGVLWANLQNLVNAIIAGRQVLTLPWYQNLAQRFQYGFAAVFTPGTYTYNYLDTTSAAALAAQITAACAVTEVRTTTGTVVAIYVAQLVGGALAKFTVTQLTAINDWVDLNKGAGVATRIISTDPDKVKCNMNVLYDGQIDPAVFEASLLAAINQFLTPTMIAGVLTYVIQFNGLLYRNGINNYGTQQWGFIDYLIENVPGCRGIQLNSLQATPATPINWVEVLLSYQPASGYFVFDSVDSAITYQPQ